MYLHATVFINISTLISTFFVWPWKTVSVSVPYLFHLPLVKKIRTDLVRFPLKNKALFTCPTELLNTSDVKALESSQATDWNVRSVHVKGSRSRSVATLWICGFWTNSFHETIKEAVVCGSSLDHKCRTMSWRAWFRCPKVTVYVWRVEGKLKLIVVRNAVLETE